MITATELKGRLARMAARFDEAELVSDEFPGMRGWGQFLDGPREHNQTGPYGTCAGAIVKSLAGRAFSGADRAPLDLLSNWWQRFKANETTECRLLNQNLRLALFCLAARLAGSAARELSSESESILLERLLPGGMWGDWWISADRNDQSPRAFTSAICLLCLTLFRDPNGALSERLEPTTIKLEDNLAGSPDLPVLYRVAALVAIMSARGGMVSAQVRSQMKGIAFPSGTELGGLAVYFYDFKYENSEAGRTMYARDYFIIPTEVLLGIAGFQRRAPALLRFRAEVILRAVHNILIARDGLYRPQPEQRISTKNQAWVAILLKLAASDYEKARLVDRIIYELRRERSGNLFTEKVIPIMTLVSAAAANSVVPSTDYLSKAIMAVCLLVVAGLYSPMIFRTMVRGRE